MKIAGINPKSFIKYFLSNSLFFTVLLFYLSFSPGNALGNIYKGVVVLHSANAGKVELNIANLLSDRIKEAGVKDVQVISKRIEPETGKDKLCILLGKPGNFDAINDCFMKNRIPPLTGLEPGPEGFLLTRNSGQNLVVAAGIDDRGCLYAVGEFLRQIIVRDGNLQLPENLNIRTAPAFEIRGTQVQQSSVALNLAKTRPYPV